MLEPVVQSLLGITGNLLDKKELWFCIKMIIRTIDKMYIFSSTECADGATSYYKEFTYNNKRVIISNNVRIYVHRGKLIKFSSFSYFCAYPNIKFSNKKNSLPFYSYKLEPCFSDHHPIKIWQTILLPL